MNSSFNVSEKGWQIDYLITSFSTQQTPSISLQSDAAYLRRKAVKPGLHVGHFSGTPQLIIEEV